MAHYFINPTAVFAPKLRNMLSLNEAADDAFADVRDMMSRMITGDGSADDDYSVIAIRFGFDSAALAHAAFQELDSAYSKTSGNGSVINVRAARDQMYSVLRGA